MKKIIILTFISVVLIVGSFMFTNISNAVYYARDTIYLYENRSKVKYNGIYLVEYKTHSEKCIDGVCSIGQQFYPVTIHISENKTRQYHA